LAKGNNSPLFIRDSGVSRYLPVTDSRLMEVQRVVCQRVFGNFEFAAKGAIEVFAVSAMRKQKPNYQPLTSPAPK
jgi:hypothetical protein